MCPANIMAKDKTKNVLKMEYLSTPDIIWKQLKQKYNFTVDACSSDKNHLLPKYWTKENSALEKNWDNEIVYCHPMYDSKIVKFIEKAFQHKCLAVFLIPANPNSNYFLKYFWNNDENAIRKNIKIHFLPRNDKGYIMKSDNGESPDVGYIRPLMIVEIDNRYD